MNIISPAFKIITPIDGIEILKTLEEVGRTCYKSEDKITDDSCNKFVRTLLTVDMKQSLNTTTSQSN